MNFDRFKDVKLNLDSTAEYDADYVASLNTLKKQPNKKSILPIIGTVAAAVLVIVGVSAWALLGRGVRGTEQDDDIIVLTPAEDSDTFADKPQDKTPEKDYDKKPDDEKTDKAPTTPDSDGADTPDGDKPADTPTVSRPDSDGADTPDGDKPADTPTVSRPDSNTGDGAGSYVDDYVTPETLKADREYADYLIKIRDTAGAMLIKGKKTDGTFTVTASFIGSAKVGDKITVQALPDSENEYMLALKPKGAEYVGIAKEWQFEITPEYKTDDSFNHEKLESTTQMRLFNDYIYSYRDKSYVPPLSDGDIRTELGSWRTVLQDDGKEIAFKYAGDFFPHHTKFANVDIYSTPSTKKEVLLVYEKPGPTDGQVSYKRRYVELCELPEQMKNDPYYDMYIVEHIDGRREMFRRGKQIYPYYDDCFKYTEGNTLKDTFHMIKDYLGYDITTAEAISSIRVISSDSDDIRVAIDNKADVKRLYDALAKSSYSVNNIPKDLNSCNVVINLIRSDPYYAYTMWVNLDTGITRCGYKLDDDTVKIIKELI